MNSTILSTSDLRVPLLGMNRTLDDDTSVTNEDSVELYEFSEHIYIYTMHACVYAAKDM